MTHARRYRRLPDFCRRFGPVASAIVAVLLVSGPVSPLGSEDKTTVPQHDPAVLAEIAQDVINRASTSHDRTLPESSSRDGVPDEITVVGSAPDPAPALSHFPPGREGISVSAPATASPPKPAPATSGAAGYQSNSWRRGRPESSRSLTLLVWRLHPVVRARPRVEGPGRPGASRGPLFRVRVPPAPGAAEQGAPEHAGESRRPAPRSPRQPPEGSSARRIARGGRRRWRRSSGSG